MPFKSSCLTSLENKRFDKVKVVRESMNRALELWKEIPGNPDEVPVSPQLNHNSSKDNGVGRSPVIGSKGLEMLPKEPIPSSKSSPVHRSSPIASQNGSPPKGNYRKQSAPVARKMDFNKQTIFKVNDAERIPSTVEKTVPDTTDTDKGVILENEKRVTEEVISDKTRAGCRYGSRVFPFADECELDEYVYGNQKEVEDLSLIQKQLLQIENQQSSLLNLLQKFIGNSRSGMNSLETRVNGLEKALDEISYDLAVSTGRVSSTGLSCCMGTEFLSPKNWWKTEGQCSSTRSPFRESVSDRRFGSPTSSVGALRNSGRSLEMLRKNSAQVQNRNRDSFTNCIQQRT